MPAPRGRSHRELMAYCQCPSCGLPLGARPSLDRALALGSSPSAALAATSSHSWGHRHFCVPPHCNSATGQETDPRISSSFQREPFVKEQWLTMALRASGASSVHSGISFCAGFSSCLCHWSCLTDGCGLGEPSKKTRDNETWVPSGKTVARALLGSAEAWARITLAVAGLHLPPPPPPRALLLQGQQRTRGGHLGDGLWCRFMEINTKF